MSEKETSSDPLLSPSTAYLHLNEDRFKAEMELFDRYQAFAAELLRISLAGIAVGGFLFKEAQQINNLIRIGIICFGSAAALSLLYRYTLTDAFRLYLEGLRFKANQHHSASKLKKRKTTLSLCFISKGGSALALAAGSFLLS